MDNSADIALVHNSMPVAAPPILQYLRIPSLYFCYEHPRHIYEKDIIQRTGKGITEMTLKPLSHLEKKIDMESAKAAFQVVTFSNYMQSNVLRIYNRDSKIVRPGVDSSFFTPKACDRKADDYVLSVGALWPFKGHEDAIRILGCLHSEIRPSLVIVADREYPGYSSKLLSLAQSLSVKVVISKGITDEVLRDLYRKAHAVLCCQRREPYGLVPLEAMACGTPVIARDEGGFSDNIIHNRTGYLYSGKAEDGAKLLLQILTRPDSAACVISDAGKFIREERTVENGAIGLGEILEAL